MEGSNLPVKARAQSKHEEYDLGPSDGESFETLDSSNDEGSPPITLEAIRRIVEDKLARECIEGLRQTVVDQNLRIQELEAKIILLEKYIEKTEKVEREEIPEMRDRIEDLELRCDDNEQYHRRLCLRFNGMELKKIVMNLAKSV